MSNNDPASGPPDARRMAPAELLGSHSHPTTAGVTVHVWRRQETFLARGKYERRAFGVSLGSNEREATSQLCRLLTAIEDGTFQRPSEKRHNPLPARRLGKQSLRELCGTFLAEKRRIRGKSTSDTYMSRLAPVLEFADSATAKKRWPATEDIDREFVLELRSFLFKRQTTRNGRAGGGLQPMSERLIINCLETLRNVLSWAKQPDVYLLPGDFVIPLSRDLIGSVPTKDPLRTNGLPMERRIEIVRHMDRWQLRTLSALLVLPLRHEDLGGMLISDIDWQTGTLRLGTRFGGSDFNKGRVTVTMPLPSALMPILLAARGDRVDGPLFCSRRRCSNKRPKSELDLAHRLKTAMARAPGIETEQDRKQFIRDFLQKLGAVTTSAISKELGKLFNAIGVPAGVRPYDLRGAVTQDMNRANVRFLELRYLTEHTVNDIMNAYTPLDPIPEMQKYFAVVEPLLDTIHQRFAAMG